MGFPRWSTARQHLMNDALALDPACKMVVRLMEPEEWAECSLGELVERLKTAKGRAYPQLPSSVGAVYGQSRYSRAEHFYSVPQDADVNQQIPEYGCAHPASRQTVFSWTARPMPSMDGNR